ncbi:hypothetical protein ACIGO9_34600 [Nocardia asteroides]|uniref:hypothetical protein n=1 Tax=Nocardia asteroides TaxID=1824 RepID=UPI0037CAFF5B
MKRKYYTHWGGQSVHLDLLPGPAAAVRFATAQQSVDNWVADLEAAAVIDLDQRVLLWYSDSCDDAALRCGVLATMKDTWQDWVVYWAPAGDQDVVDYCAGRWRACAVIVIEDGRNRHYRTALSLTTLIGTGPALVDVVSEWEAAARPLVLPPRAVVLVPAERVGAHWALDDSAEDIDVVSAGWGEWDWEDWRPRIEAGGTAARPAKEAVVRGCGDLSVEFDRHQVMDTGTELAAVLLNISGWIEQSLRSSAVKMQRVEDNSFVHRPIELTEEELERTRVAIRAAQSRFDA